MDERRRKETEMRLSPSSRSELSDASSTSGERPESGEKLKGTQLDDYFIEGRGNLSF